MVTVLRTPVLIGGLLLVAQNDDAIRAMTLLWSYYGTTEGSVAPLLLLLRLDYWVYPVNMVVSLSALLAAFVLLEVKHRRLPRNPNAGWDVLTAAACLVVALLPPLLSTNIQPGRLQVWIWLSQVVLLWVFMLCNAGLWLFHRYVASKSWFARFTNFTFPVSDIGFYMFQRERRGPHGTLKMVPTVAYAAVVAVLLGLNATLIMTSEKAEKIVMAGTRPLDRPYSVVYDRRGFWFANADPFDALSGLWYYDEASGRASPYLRIYDLENFYFRDGFLYLYDRFDSEVQKIDIQTKEVVWKVSVREGFGSTRLAMKDGVILAIAEGGFVLALTEDGTVLAERQLTVNAVYPQLWSDGRVAFVSGDPQMRVWDGLLRRGDTIPLPLEGSVPALEYSDEASRRMLVTTWTDYDEQSETMYVATVWGEVFRYDIRHDGWLPTLHMSAGLRSIAVDKEHGLLFGANYFRGFIEVADLESGRRRGRILAKPLGRFIVLDRARKSGILTTEGYGMHRFDYAPMTTVAGR